MTMQANQSEVRRLLEQIDAEYEAAKRGMQGLAQGTAYHAFITARMERIQGLQARLGEVTLAQRATLEIKLSLYLDDMIESGKDCSFSMGRRRE